jgi:2-polyprenyl-3-methyl-5-hydroxy-6-metoxy-1,4-benzoquinol methylase
LDNAISTWKKRSHIAQRIISKNFFRLLGTVNKSILPKEKFCIKKGYHHAASVIDFDDTSNTDEWQKEVYLLARDVLAEKKYQTVIDVGCGSAYKLVHYLGSYKTVGIEVESTYKWLMQKYPEQEWLQFDKTDPSTLQADLIICSDVIEHIYNPNTLLEFIQRIDCKEIILSTPERESVAGKNDYGPPENPSHYREWNAEELISMCR